MPTGNTSGGGLEQFVERLFETHGVHIRTYLEDKGTADLLTPWVLVKNVPFKNIYGSTSRTEFVLCCILFNRRIRIECKWQATNGSTDEKLPYLFLNARDAMPEDEIILIVDGEGFRHSAINWLKRECAKITTKQIRVMRMAEFKTFIDDLLKAEAT